MKKVQILALHLNHGGIEKAIADLANNLTPYFNVEIISTYNINNKPAYDINNKVTVRYLINNLKPERDLFKKYVKSFHFFKAFILGIKSIKIIKLKKKLMIKEIKNSDADVIISTRIYHNRLLSKYGKSNIKKIAWEHNHHQNNDKYFSDVIKSAENLDYLVLVSKSLYNDYAESMKNCLCKCVYIPNMIDIKKPVISKLDSNILINVSRFSKEKGLFDLIDVVEIIKDTINNIKLELIGDGPLFNEIKSYVLEKKLQDNVIFYGFQSSDFVNNHLSKAALYVMTSFTESFGISLLESFSHGVPAIAFDSAEGACELIDNKELLIKDRNKEEMAREIIQILDDRKTLSSYGNTSLSISSNFIPDKVVKKWENIIN